MLQALTENKKPFLDIFFPNSPGISRATKRGADDFTNFLVSPLFYTKDGLNKRVCGTYISAGPPCPHTQQTLGC